MNNFNNNRNFGGNKNYNKGGENMNKNNNNANEPMRLAIEPIPFDGVMKSKLTTTIALSKTINQLFRPVFSDYEGCIIAPDAYGQLQVALYFKDKGMIGGEDVIKSLFPVTERIKGTSAIDRVMQMNLRNSSKAYDLSKETKDILSEFIYTRGNSKVNWNQHIVEQTERQYNGQVIYVKVVGLDLVRLVRKIYGGKIDGSRIDYNISIIKPIGADMTGFNQNFLINIQQLDSKEVERLANEIGVVPQVGTIQMVR